MTQVSLLSGWGNAVDLGARNKMDNGRPSIEGTGSEPGQVKSGSDARPGRKAITGRKFARVRK